METPTQPQSDQRDSLWAKIRRALRSPAVRAIEDLRERDAKRIAEKAARRQAEADAAAAATH